MIMANKLITTASLIIISLNYNAQKGGWHIGRGWLLKDVESQMNPFITAAIVLA